MTAPVKPLDRRARQKQRTRQAIERCAIELFERHGVDGTTVEQIAESADISRRTFFRYFRTKEDVLLQPRYGAAEILGRLIAGRPADEPPLLAIRHSVQALDASLPADALPMLRRRSEILMNDPALRDRSAVLVAGWQSAITTALEQRQARCVQQPRETLSDLDPSLVAAIACAVFQWAAMKWLDDAGIELRDWIDDGLQRLGRSVALR